MVAPEVPVVMMSLPAPPAMESSPLPAEMVSAAVLPVSVSAPPPELTLTAAFEALAFSVSPWPVRVKFSIVEKLAVLVPLPIVPWNPRCS